MIQNIRGQSDFADNLFLNIKMLIECKALALALVLNDFILNAQHEIASLSSASHDPGVKKTALQLKTIKKSLGKNALVDCSSANKFI